MPKANNIISLRNSSIQPNTITEETLDPKDPKDWDLLRELGHRMIDDIFDSFIDIRNKPVWQAVPNDVKTQLQLSVPHAPSDVFQVYEKFKQLIKPYPTGNAHPRFWGWVMGTGSPLASLADLLASSMNPHIAGYDQSAALVEEQVINWFKELFHFPENSSGLLVSGGTMANLIGLTVARHKQAGFDIRNQGLQSNNDRPLVVYCSTETHSWSQKAIELLGIGNNYLRRIAVNNQFQIDLRELEQTIDKDRNEGLNPICVIATAGTVNTGSTDDLMVIGQICEQQGLWFHIDGAFGALVALTENYKHIVKGMEKADSIAFDFHKWMYMPFDAGCVIVKDASSHKETFSVSPSYLATMQRGLSSKPMNFASLGVDLSRSFRALKIWFSIQTEGIDKFGRLIEQNINQAFYLEKLILNEKNLQLLAPVSMNVVCFRFYIDTDEIKLNQLNKELLVRLQETGIAVISSTIISNKFALRVAITNHRSHLQDFDLLINTVLNIGLILETELT